MTRLDLGKLDFICLMATEAFLFGSGRDVNFRVLQVENLGELFPYSCGGADDNKDLMNVRPTVVVDPLHNS
jgi:hypothetical protein